MKILSAAAGISLLALSACMSGEDMAEPTAADPFVDKRMVTETGNVIILKSDGTVGGMIRNKAVVGTYSADATEICSTYTAPDFLVGKEYCSTPVVTGDTVIFNRRDGSQSPVYTIEG